MSVDVAMSADYDAWMILAREAEPLFGPMADEESFQEALRQAIAGGQAYCLRADGSGGPALKGGIIITEEANEIAWFFVSADQRGKGYGRELLRFAMGRLDEEKDAFVQTFDDTLPDGKVARGLYRSFGFSDMRAGGRNPAGVPTVVMRRKGGL